MADCLTWINCLNSWKWKVASAGEHENTSMHAAYYFNYKIYAVVLHWLL